MNNLKKVGLTALATTLVTSASVAGELSVSGSAALSYTGLSTASGTNPWAQGDSVKFNGGGDLDNGMTVSVYYELDGGTYDDYNLKLGMGDMGTLSFSGNSSSGSGVDKLKDIVPNAYSAVYEATDAVDSGLIDASGNQQAGQWGYDITVGNAALSASYNPEPGTDNKDAETGFAIVYSGLMDGLEMVKKYVSNVPDISLDYLLNSDDPTTVIFSKSKNLESYPESIAIRIPKNKICLQLIQNLKKPITSTSANFTGKKVPKYFIVKNLIILQANKVNMIDIFWHVNTK